MFKFMSHFKFLVVPLALMLVAMVAIFGFGCGMFPDSGGDTSAKLQTVNKAIAQAVVLAYQSGGNQLAYQQVDKAVADGKLTPEQAAQLKAAADKGIAALQEVANSSDAATPTATAPPAATSTAAAPLSTGP